MKPMLILLVGAPLLTAAAPAPASEPSTATAISEMQRTLDDPRTEQKMAGTMQSLTNALMNLPVGELQAALDGRTASPDEKRLTVRDMARRDDPQFEAKLRGQLAQSGPAIRRGMKSLSAALPALVKSFEEAGAAIQRATANLPDPSYPKR